MNHTEQALAVARETGWNIDAVAADRDWADVGMGPVGQHRDSDVLDQSNFAVVLSELRALFGNDVDVARFGHWGFGWVEEIIWNTGNPAVVAAVESWREHLSDYPVASEDDLSEREYDDAIETLTQCYDVPEDRAGDVFRWLFDAYSHCRGEDYRSVDVAEALEALGIVLD